MFRVLHTINLMSQLDGEETLHAILILISRIPTTTLRERKLADIERLGVEAMVDPLDSASHIAVQETRMQ